jgi:TATA-box binding protein (TBP) (component of TFIID and TFIIIB)
MEKEIYFTPYKVSTITCNANIGENLFINLSVLYNNITPLLEDNNIIWIQNSLNEYKGINPKKIRNSKKEKKKKTRFDNQITILYQFNKTYRPNIKIFKNGNIQLTGINKVESDVEEIAKHIINKIKKIYEIDNKINLNYETENKDEFLNKLKYGNFKIRMINTDFKTYYDADLKEKFYIRRKELHNLLISNKYNNKSSFQPGIYQGVKLEYYYTPYNNSGICQCKVHNFSKKNNQSECKKVTIAIFESGSILITGGINFDQVNSAYKHITNVIKDNINIVKKNKINFEN